MQYILKKITYLGAPRSIDETTYTQTILIETGISGQTYNGFTNTDTTDINFPFIGLDADGIKNLIASASTEFVATKYPNT